MVDPNAHDDDIPLAPINERDDEGLGFASPSPDATAEGTSSEADWFLAGPGGKQLGPFHETQLRAKIAAGELQLSDLVWKAGFEKWLPLGEAPGLENLRPAEPKQSPTPDAGKAGFMSQVNKVLSSPAFFRIAGLVCVGLALITVVASAVVWLIKGASAFSQVIPLLLIFIVCEGVASMIEALRRIEGMLAQRNDAGSTAPGGDQ